jgi:hypothetical protein
MAVRREVAVEVHQHVADRTVAAVPQVQHHVLGQRTDPVDLRRGLDQGRDRPDLPGVERPDHLDVRGRPLGVGVHRGTLGAPQPWAVDAGGRPAR